MLIRSCLHRQIKLFRQILVKGAMFNKDHYKGFFVGLVSATVMIFIQKQRLFSFSVSDFQRSSLNNETLRNDDDFSVADELSRKVRVLVWVAAGNSEKHLEKAEYIKRTWGPRANVLLFLGSETNKTFPIIGLNVPDGTDHLTAKTMAAFNYVYKHHLDDADWFMKADDDTFIIMENLRYFLSDKKPGDPIHYGQLFKYKVKQGYYSGGGGYVLSKEALRRFGINQETNPDLCAHDGGYEDMEFGKCMEKLGVLTANSDDKYNRSRFHFEEPDMFLDSDFPDWYEKRDINKGRGGLDSVSDYAITYHRVPKGRMLVMDYCVYHLRPYGIRFGNRELNPPPDQKLSILSKPEETELFYENLFRDVIPEGDADY